MAFNDKEQAIIDWGVKNGKNATEIKSAIANLRLGIKAEQPQVAEAIQTTTGEKITSAFQGGVSRIAQGFEQAQPGKGKTILDALESGLKLGEGAAQVVGAPLAPVLEPVGKAFQGVANVIADVPEVQKFAESRAGEVTSRVADDVAGLTNLAGIGTGLGATRSLTSLYPKLKNAPPSVTAPLTAAEETLARSRAANIPKPTATPAIGQLKQLVNNVRFQISDIDPQVETILKRSTYDEVNRYFQQARNSKADPSKPSTFALAGDKAEEAFNVIKEAKFDAIKGKKAILEASATERLPGNVLNDVFSKAYQSIQERFGVRINTKTGQTEPIPGRQSTLDATDQRLVVDYIQRFNKLGIAPTLKEVDDFVDWSQSQLYKQSQSLSKLETASEPVISQLRQLERELNNVLKEKVGNGYGEVNARVAKLLEQQDELSRVLGAEGDKGASLMKSLFSPAGERARRIFQEVYDETGIDLVKDATLAKFAAESVGDVRATSLLKQLDIATQDVSTLDLTKPLSIIKFIRERADLDAQELANEIIRRANASASK